VGGSTPREPGQPGAERWPPLESERPVHAANRTQRVRARDPRSAWVQPDEYVFWVYALRQSGGRSSWLASRTSTSRVAVNPGR
jgi:hypothetical protein